MGIFYIVFTKNNKSQEKEVQNGEENRQRTITRFQGIRR